MTIPEAAQLVIQAGAMAKGGDVFVLDMGEPVKIKELAGKMVRLSGFEPYFSYTPDAKKTHDGDIEIQFTGLRPGEKLYEELLIGDEVVKTAHPRIMSANEVALSLPEVQALLGKLLSASEAGDSAHLQQLLVEAPLGYRPSAGLVDHLWQCPQRKQAAKALQQTPRDEKLVLPRTPL